MQNRREAIYVEIRLGEPICEKLRTIYHDGQHWQICYKDVANKFSLLKAKMKKFYTDKDNEQILRELSHYSESDIRDAINS